MLYVNFLCHFNVTRMQETLSLIEYWFFDGFCSKFAAFEFALFR